MRKSNLLQLLNKCKRVNRFYELILRRQKKFAGKYLQTLSPQ